MSANWKETIEAVIRSGDPEALRRLARTRAARVIRYLNSRLYTDDEEEKWRTVRAFGIVAGIAAGVDAERVADLLRRFAWALNDESGAVPYGIPEAMGEILATRPEFQRAFLPVLCSLLTEEEMSQTGPVERGAIWAVGRVGPPAAEHSREVVAAVRAAADSHPDAVTRGVAAQALERITGTSQS